MTDAPGSSPTQQPVRAVQGGSGLPENVAGALSYLLGPLTGIAFFIIDRQRPFVRFHAVQCIGVTIAWVVIAVALMVLSAILGVIPIIGFLIGLLLSLGVSIVGFALWIWLMYQAYSGKTWEVPVIGTHVRRIAADTGAAAG